MIDIARAAGVSKSTVSLVLRDSPLVKGETRQRVEQAMQRLGYVYNRGAASLRAASSDFVGMVISDLTNQLWRSDAVHDAEAVGLFREKPCRQHSTARVRDEVLRGGDGGCAHGTGL